MVSVAVATDTEVRTVLQVFHSVSLGLLVFHSVSLGFQVFHSLSLGFLVSGVYILTKKTKTKKPADRGSKATNCLRVRGCSTLLGAHDHRK